LPAADLGRRQPVVTAVTWPYALTWAVTGNGQIGAQHQISAGVVVLLVLAVAVTWLVRLLLWPFGPCRWCRGKKTNPGSTRRRFGNCRHCKGSGYRIRFGARTVHRALLRRKEPR
jgi:hypothetical protein